MLKIRRPLGRLIFNMGIAIPGKTVFLIETAPCRLTSCLNIKHFDKGLPIIKVRLSCYGVIFVVGITLSRIVFILKLVMWSGVHKWQCCCHQGNLSLTMEDSLIFGLTVDLCNMEPSHFLLSQDLLSRWPGLLWSQTVDSFTSHSPCTTIMASLLLGLCKRISVAC